MDKCITGTNPKQGQQVIAHTDDVVVVVNTLQKLQDMVNTWFSTMINNGVKINIAKGKTELIHISRRTE